MLEWIFTIDKLRGGVEPARYKDYILTLLFVKYVSDRFKSSDNWDIDQANTGKVERKLIELSESEEAGEIKKEQIKVVGII